jgi:hypothetical protein
MLGDQRFVGGDHRFARLQRRLDRRQRRLAGAAHQFDKTIDAGIGRQRHGIFRPGDAAQIDPALLHLRTRGNGDHAHAAPAARRQDAALLLDQPNDFGAHGTEPRNTQFEGCDHDENDLPEKTMN